MAIAKRPYSALGHALVLFFTVCLGTGPISGAQQSYAITDLGPAVPHSSLPWFDGDSVSTVSMNATGDVVAATPTPSVNTHVLFRNGQVIVQQCLPHRASTAKGGPSR